MSGCHTQGIRRTSNLLAPIMQLAGHGGDVLTMRFSPDGQVLASGSFDRTILLWRTYDECENYMMVRGHKNAVLEVHWFSNGEQLLSCSADKSVRCWDADSGMQVRLMFRAVSGITVTATASLWQCSLGSQHRWQCPGAAVVTLLPRQISASRISDALCCVRSKQH